MSDDTFAGTFDELGDCLLELWGLTGAGANPGWLAREDFLPDANIPEGWRPTSPPGDVEWITAVTNFDHILDRWRWLLKSNVWRKVPGVLPAIPLEMINSEAGLQRFGAGTAANGGNFESALAGLAWGMERIAKAIDGEAPRLLAAIKVAAQSSPRDRSPRSDEPDEGEIAMARQVCKANPRITRETLRLQMAIGPAKAGKLIDIMRDEGLHQSRKRKSREKGD